MYTSIQNRYKSTDFGVPPAKPDHGLNLCDHNCGYLVQWKCDVPTEVGAIVYTVVPVHVPLEIPRYTLECALKLESIVDLRPYTLQVCTVCTAWVHSCILSHST